MLQIVTKMYFRPDVEVFEYLHRNVYYTNALLSVHSEAVLPIGRLLPSSTMSSWINSVTVEATEFLEAVLPDGSPSGHVATGGLELLDDLADVLSFGLNVTFSRSHDLLEREVPRPQERARPQSSAGLLRQTFDPGTLVTPEVLTNFDSFFGDLLALERPYFEAAMRAIRRVRRACERAGENATTAFTDLVAALESLSHEGTTPAPTWDRLDPKKQRLFDDALNGAGPDVAMRVRQAVLESEHAGATHSFVHFVLDHVDASYYREGAIGAASPVRKVDTERLLKWAYSARSQNVHRLADIKERYWIFPDRPETADAEDGTKILTLEGMRRLAYHVIVNYVRRAPKGVVADFDWRRDLPGTARVAMAPQYWIHRADGLTKERAELYFTGMVELAIEATTGRGHMIEMDEGLSKIESLVPTIGNGPEKAALVGIYAIFERLVGDQRPRGTAASFMETYFPSLAGSPVIHLVVDMLTDGLDEWADSDVVAAADLRHEDRGKRRHLDLPRELDAGIQALAAQVNAEVGNFERAAIYAARAVEELPGNEQLVEWEENLEHAAAALDVGALVRRVTRSEDDDSETTPDADQSAADNAPSTD